MLILKYSMLALFAFSTAIHLYASLKQNKPLRNMTKPFILIGLFGFYLAAAEPAVPTVLLALAFSWLGDMLLIPPGTKWFAAGGTAFTFSHGFFVISYAAVTDFSKLPSALTVLLPAIFVTAALIVFRCLRQYLPESLRAAMLLYLVVNGMMNCFAWFRAISGGGVAGLVTAVGALLFFVSDSTLFFVRFHKEGRIRTHFLVMLTYSLGEFLIVLGLMMK